MKERLALIDGGAGEACDRDFLQIDLNTLAFLEFPDRRRGERVHDRSDNDEVRQSTSEAVTGSENMRESSACLSLEGSCSPKQFWKDKRCSSAQMRAH